MTASPKYVGPGEAVKLFFANFFNFKGRSTRSEFWWGGLLVGLVGLALYGVLMHSARNGNYSLMKTVTVLYYIYAAIIFFPSWSITWRRLHDTGKSGFWIFINILPIVGQFWFLGLMIKASGPANKWGVPAGQQGMAGGMPGMGGYPNGMNGQMMGQRQGQPMPGQPMQPGMQQPGFGQGGMQGMAQGAMNMMGQAFGGGQPGQSPLSSLGGAAAALGAAAMGAVNNMSQGQNPFGGMGGNPGMGGMQGMGRVCLNCGTQSMGNDMFCQNCGTRLM